MTWIQTYSGKAFDLLDPKPEQIDLNDIAHALSNLCRYTGHCREFYSVAQHSVLVSDFIAAQGASLTLQRQALLHDAVEAYINDVSMPLKQAMRKVSSSLRSDYDVLEDHIQRCVMRRFGLPETIASEVHNADMRVLATERRVLLTKEPRPWSVQHRPISDLSIYPWSPSIAHNAFMTMASRLGIG